MTDLRTSFAKTENVLIRAGDCAVTILPLYGGKIASIRIGELELLQPPLAPIAPRTRTMPFDAADAGGWDECLPSVAPCAVKTEAGVAEIPDHGDLWRVEWAARDESSDTRDKVTLVGKCFSLPLELERRMELLETGGHWHLNLQYNADQHQLESSSVVVVGASFVCGRRGRSDYVARVNSFAAAGGIGRGAARHAR